jgi:transposase
MGMLADRRDELGPARTQVAGRLHRLLLELLPGGARKFGSARQARALIATVKPRDLAGKTRRRLAAGLTGELEATGKKTRALGKELTGLVTARGSTLIDLHGIGPSGAARLLADAAGTPPVRPPRPVRLLERHRPAGRVLRQPVPPPALPRREPAHQPGPAHHGGRPWCRIPPCRCRATPLRRG